MSAVGAIHPPHREAWLLPALGLRVISWIPKPDVDRELEDHYVDVAEITVTSDHWSMAHHYLDVRVWTDSQADTARTALARAFHLLEGVTAHGYDLEGWLRTAYGIELWWP